VLIVFSPGLAHHSAVETRVALVTVQHHPETRKHFSAKIHLLEEKKEARHLAQMRSASHIYLRCGRETFRNYKFRLIAIRIPWTWEGDRLYGSSALLAVFLKYSEPRFAIFLPPFRPRATVAGSFSFAKVEERYYRRIMHDLRESPKLTDNFAETSRLVLSTITSGILKEDSLSPSRFRTSFWKRLLLPGRTKPGWRDSTESPVTLPG
jgi:hypothetical protein